MKLGLLTFLLLTFLSGGIQTISRINRYAEEAATAYKQKDYTAAVTAYEHLLHDMEVDDNQLRLNLAHAYFKAGQLEQANQQYRQLTSHPSEHIRAVVLLQLGNIASAEHKYKQALANYKSALIAEPANETARYNYELLKKYLLLNPDKAAPETAKDTPAAEEKTDAPPPPPQAELQEPQPSKKPDSNGNQEAEVDTPEESADGSIAGNGAAPGSNNAANNNADQPAESEKEAPTGQEAGDTEGYTSEDATASEINGSGTSEHVAGADQRAQTRSTRFRQMNLSPEKAQMLLNAMRDAERQYIQQLPKKATKKPDPSKPDW